MMAEKIHHPSMQVTKQNAPPATISLPAAAALAVALTPE